MKKPPEHKLLKFLKRQIDDLEERLMWLKNTRDNIITQVSYRDRDVDQPTPMMQDAAIRHQKMVAERQAIGERHQIMATEPTKRYKEDDKNAVLMYNHLRRLVVKDRRWK